MRLDLAAGPARMPDLPPANAVLKVSMGAVVHRACRGCGAANSKKLDRCEACGAPTPPPEHLTPREVDATADEPALLAWWRRHILKER